MSACYERGFVGNQPGSGATGPIVALRTGANEIRLQRFELEVTGTGLASGERLALFRVSATGTPTTSGLGQAADAADAASLTNVDSTWSVNPTITGQPLRSRYAGPNSYDWSFLHWHEQNGLVVPANSGLVLWRETNPAAVMSQCFGTIGWEE